MASLDTIRRITIRAIVQGVKEATQQLFGLKGAQEAVAQTSEKTSRAQLSVANALDRQRRSLDSAYRAQQDFSKSQQTFDRALQQGLINQQEHARLLDLARKRQEEVANGTDRTNNAMQRLGNTLTRRFIFAALINEMRDLITYLLRVPSLLAAVSDSARRLNVNPQQLQAYAAAAGDKGIDLKQFSAGAQAMASALNEAKTSANDLYKLMALNGGQAKSFEEALLRVADMVKNARTEQDKFNILQRANLPSTSEWVKFMEQGADAIKRAAAEHRNLAANDGVLRIAEQANGLWDKIVNKVQIYARFAAGAMMQGPAIISQLFATGRLAPPREPTGGVTVRYNAGTRDTPTGRPTVDPKVLETQLNNERQRIGLLGEIATVSDQVRSKQIELNIASLNGVNITKEQRNAVLELVRIRAEEQETAIRLANGAATAMEMRLTKERELNLLVRRGILTQEQANASMQAYARTIEETMRRQEVFKAALPNLKQLELDARNFRQGLDDLSTNTLTSFGNAITDGITRTRTWGDAFRNFGLVAVRAITDLIVKMTILAPLARAIGGSGFLGSLLGGSILPGGVGSAPYHSGGEIGSKIANRYIHPAYFDDAPRFHGGGEIGPNERPIIAEVGEEVLRRDDPRHRRNGGGQGNTIITENHYHGPIDASMRAYFDMQARQMKREAVSESVAATQKYVRDTYGAFNK